MLGALDSGTARCALPPGGEGLAARLLYTWPHAAPYLPLRERGHASGEEVMVRLRRLVRLGARGRCIVSVEPSGLAAFDVFLLRLHGAVRQADGLEAAWLGKGRGAVICLATTFALMDWSAAETAEPPEVIGADAVERAVAVVGLLPSACSVVSHTALDAPSTRGAERLVEAGVLQPLASEKRPQGGRPTLRWQVNPMLTARPRGPAEKSKRRGSRKTSVRWASDEQVGFRQKVAERAKSPRRRGNRANRENPSNTDGMGLLQQTARGRANRRNRANLPAGERHRTVNRAHLFRRHGLPDRGPMS